MRSLFTKTFFKFFFTFIIIIGVAFGVLIYAASKEPPQVSPVDNVALPQ